MRSHILSRALNGMNSARDYADMAEGKNVLKTHSYCNAPYQCGDRNFLREYTILLKQKGVVK